LKGIRKKARGKVRRRVRRREKKEGEDLFSKP